MPRKIISGTQIFTFWWEAMQQTMRFPDVLRQGLVVTKRALVKNKLMNDSKDNHQQCIRKNAKFETGKAV